MLAGSGATTIPLFLDIQDFLGKGMNYFTALKNPEPATRGGSGRPLFLNN